MGDQGNDICTRTTITPNYREIWRDFPAGMFPWIARVLLNLHYKCASGVIHDVWYVNVAAAISAVTDV